MGAGEESNARGLEGRWWSCCQSYEYSRPQGRAVIGGTGNHGRSVVDILAQGAPIPSRSYIELF